MYPDDAVFFITMAIFVVVVLVAYLVVEVNVIKTILDDYIWYTYGGGSNADTTVADD